SCYGDDALKRPPVRVAAAAVKCDEIEEQLSGCQIDSDNRTGRYRLRLPIPLAAESVRHRTSSSRDSALKWCGGDRGINDGVFQGAARLHTAKRLLDEFGRDRLPELMRVDRLLLMLWLTSSSHCQGPARQEGVKLHVTLNECQTPAPGGEEATRRRRPLKAAAEGDEAPPSRPYGRSKKSQSQAQVPRDSRRTGANEDAEELTRWLAMPRTLHGGDPDAAAEDEDLPEQEVQRDPATGPAQHPQNHRGGSEWNLATVPGLAELSLKGLVPILNVLNRVDPAQQAKLLKRLPVDVSKKVTGPLIRRRKLLASRVQSAVPVCDVTSTTEAGERMHFERDLQRVAHLAAPLSPASSSTKLLAAGRRRHRSVANDRSGSDHGSDAEERAGQQPPGLRTRCFLQLRRTYGAWTLLHRPATAHELLNGALNFNRAKLPDNSPKLVAACRQLGSFLRSPHKVDCDRCWHFLISRLLDHPGLES
uniref:RAP domain-containing protein n=1 Tax=Macrostomum lignano TaxID=282301 RepID=A0A1I8FE42_9PLAT